MASLTLSVQGMTCGHCRAKVEKALQAVDGTYGASVVLEEAMAAVDYDPARATPEQLVSAVKAAGYSAAPRPT